MLALELPNFFNKDCSNDFNSRSRSFFSFSLSFEGRYSVNALVAMRFVLDLVGVCDPDCFRFDECEFCMISGFDDVRTYDTVFVFLSYCLLRVGSLGMDGLSGCGLEQKHWIEYL